MLRLSTPLVFGLALGGGGAAAAGDHDPRADNGLGNDEILEDPDDGDNGIGNDGWDPSEPGGPCGDGSWGRIGAPRADWLHVSAIDGNDASGDGTTERPFATVAVALEAARI